MNKKSQIQSAGTTKTVSSMPISHYAKEAGLKAATYLDMRPDGTPCFLEVCTETDVLRWKHSAGSDLDNLILLAGAEGELGVQAQRGLAEIMRKVLNQWPRTRETVHPSLERLYRNESSAFRERWNVFVKTGRHKSTPPFVPRGQIDPLWVSRQFVESVVWVALIGSWFDAALYVSGDDRINNPSRDESMFRLMAKFFKKVPDLELKLKSHTTSPWEAPQACLTHFEILWKQVVEPWATREGKPHRWHQHLKKHVCQQPSMAWSSQRSALKSAFKRQLQALFSDIASEEEITAKRTLKSKV
jgi:hypothetical protein